MNRSETSRALEMLTIYQPNTPKPDNPELTVDTWAFELGDFERSAATLHPPLPAETADLLRRATGDAQASMIRRLQREGYSSAAIGRAIGRGSPWMTKNFPRK